MKTGNKKLHSKSKCNHWHLYTDTDLRKSWSLKIVLLLKSLLPTVTTAVESITEWQCIQCSQHWKCLTQSYVFVLVLLAPGYVTKVHLRLGAWIVRLNFGPWPLVLQSTRIWVVQQWLKCLYQFLWYESWVSVWNWLSKKTGP